MKSTLLHCLILVYPFLPHASPTPAPLPVPPNIPSASTAQSQLAALRVAPHGSSTGYSRDLFPHWTTQSGTCNTREVVLKRDGTNVVQDSSCAATSGSWYSPYDGQVWTAASDVDIDHVVPLSNAWKVCFFSFFFSRGFLSKTFPLLLQPFHSTCAKVSVAIAQTAFKKKKKKILIVEEQSGASSWTTTKRGAFANDLNKPQLIAVTDDVNQAKGDSGPETWKPPVGRLFSPLPSIYIYY